MDELQAKAVGLPLSLAGFDELEAELRRVIGRTAFDRDDCPEIPRPVATTCTDGETFGSFFVREMVEPPHCESCVWYAVC